MIGKTLLSAGVNFHVLHCGPSPVTVNSATSGIYDGITFEYTTALKRPDNFLLRLLIYIRAVFMLTVRLIQIWPERRRTLVHLYIMIGPLNLYVGWLCRILNLPMSQELCEWWPGVNVCDSFTKWLHKRSMFERATGVLVISKEIERRVLIKRREVNPTLLIHRLPAIVDVQRFADIAAAPEPANFTYCGTWLNDICFCVSALAMVQRAGHAASLTIVGGCAEHRDDIVSFAAQAGVHPDDVVLTGSVDEMGLAACYRSATALLLPMRDDDQSRTRMPNKLAEYLAAGRPVVAGNIGDMTEFLFDGVNAYLAEPGSEQDLARKMVAVLEDPERATRIGAAGQAACKRYLDYTAHAIPLAHFVHRCIQQHNSGEKHPAYHSMSRVYLSLRNWFCGLIALYLIAAGHVRRARQRALSGNVITSIYFHDPSPRLFRRCVGWLMRHEYSFLSVHDLIEIINRKKPIPPRAVWLSFDDGFRTFVDNILPVVQQHRIPVTLFIPTGIIQGAGIFPWLAGNRSRHALTVAELKHIAQCHEITVGSHTVTHAITRNLTESDLAHELAKSKASIEEWISYPVESFSYPVGIFSGTEKRTLIECGYRLAVTTENSFITPATDPYFVPRFSVGDHISFPEAICNMVGVWRPVIEPLRKILQGPAAAPPPPPQPAVVHSHSTQITS